MKFNREKSFFLRSDEPQRKLLFSNGSSQPSLRQIKVLKALAFSAYIFMLFMQIRNIIVFNGEPTSDASRYVGDALRNIAEETWYPVESDFVGGGVAGTGFVNFLILILHFSQNLKIAYFANILLVQLLLFSTVYIAKKVTLSDTVGYVVTVFFCMFGSFWSEVCVARTEIFFTSLAVFSLALAVGNAKLGACFSGLILAYANWARPLAAAFIIAVIWMFLCKGEKLREYIKFLASFAVMALLLATFTYFNSGEFVYNPTIASGNFLMGANENADGSYDSTVFEEGNAAYIDPDVKSNMSADEINALYKEVAFKWIKENPKDYLLLLPKKLFYFVATETYSFDSYFDNRIAASGYAYIKDLMQIVSGNGSRGIELGDIIIVYSQGFYMAVFLLFVIGIIYSMKKGYWRSMSFLYGIYLIGVAASLYTVGAGRYHFPYLFIMLITASAFVDSVVVRKNAKPINN